MSIGDTLNGSGRLETDDDEFADFCRALGKKDYEAVEYFERKWDRERYQMAEGRRPEQEGSNDD